MRISRIGLLLVSLLALVMGAACGTTVNNVGSNTTVGSGTLKTESRDVSGFTAVEVASSVSLVIEPGDEEALTVEADDNLLPLLLSEVKDGRLLLGTQPNSSWSTHNPVTFRLKVKNLNELRVGGSSSATLDNLSTDSLNLVITDSGTITLGTLAAPDKLDISVSNSAALNAESLESAAITLTATRSGRVTVTTLKTDTLTAELDGSASVTLAGTTASQTVNVKTSGAYSAENLASQTATVVVAGSGTARVNVSATLDASVSESGSIIYRGDAEVTEQTSGSGTIKKQ